MKTNLLKSVRIREGLTQKEIAETLNISVTTYSKKETGTINFSVNEVGKIVNLCKLTVKEMVDIFFEDEVEFTSTKCS